MIFLAYFYRFIEILARFLMKISIFYAAKSRLNKSNVCSISHQDGIFRGIRTTDATLTWHMNEVDNYRLPYALLKFAACAKLIQDKKELDNIEHILTNYEKESNSQPSRIMGAIHYLKKYNVFSNIQFNLITQKPRSMQKLIDFFTQAGIKEENIHIDIGPSQIFLNRETGVIAKGCKNYPTLTVDSEGQISSLPSTVVPQRDLNALLETLIASQNITESTSSGKFTCSIFYHLTVEKAPYFSAEEEKTLLSYFNEKSIEVKIENWGHGEHQLVFEGISINQLKIKFSTSVNKPTSDYVLIDRNATANAVRKMLLLLTNNKDKKKIKYYINNSATMELAENDSSFTGREFALLIQWLESKNINVKRSFLQVGWNESDTYIVFDKNVGLLLSDIHEAAKEFNNDGQVAIPAEVEAKLNPIEPRFRGIKNRYFH